MGQELFCPIIFYEGTRYLSFTLSNAVHTKDVME